MDLPWRTIVERMPDGVWVLDADGRTTYVNQRLARMVGRAPEELLGRSPAELSGDDDATAPDGTTALRRPDGALVRVAVTSAVLEDAGDGRPGTLLTLNDMSHRSDRDAALHEARSRFEQAFEESPVGISIFSTTGPSPGRALYVNRVLTEMLGFSRQELCRRTIADVTHPEDLVEGAELTQALVEGRIPSYQREKRFVRKDGGVIWAVVTSTLVRDRDGNVLYGIGQLQDVTERRRAEEALRASERQLQAILDTTTAAIYVKRAEDLRYTLANRPTEEALGVAPGGLIGRCDEEILPPAGLAALRKGDLYVLETGQPFSAEETFRLPGGEERTFFSLKVAMPGPDGRPVAVCGISTDITDSKRELAEHQLLQRRLDQAQHLQSIGELAGGVAHDFNNLLAIVLNYADFALEQLDGHPARDDVQELHDAAERGASLTRQLLLFSRQDVMAPEVVDLRGLLHGLQTLLERTLGSHVTLRLASAPGSWPVLADRGQLEQVLVNLVLNARDAMPRGGELTIGLRELEPGDGRRAAVAAAGRALVLEVTDTGTGMPPEVVRRAFDPFFTTKPAGRGTGLGLATTYGIVTALGGQVSIDSQPGAGTTVSVCLPCTEAVPAAAGEPAEPAEPSGGQRILVVEDQPAVGELTRRILVRAGYDVVVAEDPLRALEEVGVAGDPFDLLVTDMVMPHMSGVDLAERVHAERPLLPVLFMSGYADDLPEVPAGTHVLAKPFDADVLLRRVSETLRPPQGD